MKTISLTAMVALAFVTLLTGCNDNNNGIAPPPPPPALSWDQADWDEATWQ